MIVFNINICSIWLQWDSNLGHMVIHLILLGIKSSLHLLIISSSGACHRGIGGSTRRCHRLWWSRSPSGNAQIGSPPSKSLLRHKYQSGHWSSRVILSSIHQIHPQSSQIHQAFWKAFQVAPNSWDQREFQVLPSRTDFSSKALVDGCPRPPKKLTMLLYLVGPFKVNKIEVAQCLCTIETNLVILNMSFGEYVDFLALTFPSLTHYKILGFKHSDWPHHPRPPWGLAAFLWIQSSCCIHQVIMGWFKSIPQANC